MKYELKPKIWTDEMLYSREHLRSLEPTRKKVKKYRMVEIMPISDKNDKRSVATGDASSKNAD
jgi:hypothetical protein